MCEKRAQNGVVSVVTLFGPLRSLREGIFFSLPLKGSLDANHVNQWYWSQFGELR